MPDLSDGETVEVQGSASRPYELKNVAGVYSCSCPAWRNQSLPIERRTCKHLRTLRGDAAEEPAGVGGTPARRGQDDRHERDAAALAAGRELGRQRRSRPAGGSARSSTASAPTGTASSSSRARATSTSPPTGSPPACRWSRWTASCGSAASSSSGRSASCGGRTRATCGRRSVRRSSTRRPTSSPSRNASSSCSSSWRSTSLPMPSCIRTVAAPATTIFTQSWRA